MVYYSVQAKFVVGKGKDFLDLIDSDNLKNQRPDGRYIIEAMNKASIDSS